MRRESVRVIHLNPRWHVMRTRFELSVDGTLVEHVILETRDAPPDEAFAKAHAPTVKSVAV